MKFKWLIQLIFISGQLFFLVPYLCFRMRSENWELRSGITYGTNSCLPVCPDRLNKWIWGQAYVSEFTVYAILFLNYIVGVLYTRSIEIVVQQWQHSSQNVTAFKPPNHCKIIGFRNWNLTLELIVIMKIRWFHTRYCPGFKISRVKIILASFIDIFVLVTMFWCPQWPFYTRILQHLVQQFCSSLLEKIEKIRYERSHLSVIYTTLKLLTSFPLISDDKISLMNYSGLNPPLIWTLISLSLLFLELNHLCYLSICRIFLFWMFPFSRETCLHLFHPNNNQQ